MKEAKYTPGPWQIGSYRTTSEFMKHDEHIAIHDGSLALVAITGPSLCKASTADARLIAAAPDLFEACKEIIGMLDRKELVRPTENDGDSDWVIRMMEFVPRIKKVSDAIAKAEGKK